VLLATFTVAFCALARRLGTLPMSEILLISEHYQKSLIFEGFTREETAIKIEKRI